MNREEFCKILRECRQQSGKIMKTIGFELNMLPRDIYRLEKGVNNFSLNKAIDFLSVMEHAISLKNNDVEFVVENYNAFITWMVNERSGKFSQRALANAIDGSYTNIANIEVGKTAMSIDTFFKIVDVLGYTVTIEKKQ